MKRLARLQGMIPTSPMTLSVPDYLDVMFKIGSEECILSPPQVREVISALQKHLDRVDPVAG